MKLSVVDAQKLFVDASAVLDKSLCLIVGHAKRSALSKLWFSTVHFTIREERAGGVSTAFDSETVLINDTS